MRRFSVITSMLAPMLALGLAPIATSQDMGTTAAPAAAVAKGPQGDFKPGFDDLMTMLVQTRHIKLYYAGMQKNWELAAAESRDLRQALQRISQAIPVYQGNDVDAAIVSIIAPKIQAVDAAVAAGNSKQFTTAYADLTTACTACHTYLEHPFLVIKVPDGSGSAYSDQDFNVAP